MNSQNYILNIIFLLYAHTLFYNHFPQQPPIMKKVLAILSINPDYVEFAIPQLKALLSPLKLPFDILFSQSKPLPERNHDINYKAVKNFPYVTLTIPDFQKHREYLEMASKKGVMVSKFILLISEGKDYEQLIKNRDQDLLDEECRDWNQTVACDFITRNRVITRDVQHKKIHHIFQKLDVRGKIDIKNAAKRLQLVEQHEWYHGHHEEDVDKTIERVYFGVQLSSCKLGKAKFNINYQLSNRIYLGPTSANNDLAFLMCNQARINEHSLIFDPFVGTGGLIIPPATHGASVLGCDLDMRVLNGYSVGRINKKSPYYSPDKQFETYLPKINLNFDQYNLPWPNILRMDATKCKFAPHTKFDAIITDPPYGLRAMSRSLKKKENKVFEAETTQIQKIEQKVQEIEMKKSQDQDEKQEQTTENMNEEEMKKREKKKIKKQNKQKRREAVSQQEKALKKQITEKLNRDRIDNWEKFDKAVVDTTERETIFEGLLNIARRHLKVGGRLVFLYPVYEDEDYKGVESLPKCQGFEVIDFSSNQISKNNQRILVTLEKLSQ